MNSNEYFLFYSKFYLHQNFEYVMGLYEVICPLFVSIKHWKYFLCLDFVIAYLHVIFIQKNSKLSYVDGES